MENQLKNSLNLEPGQKYHGKVIYTTDCHYGSPCIISWEFNDFKEKDYQEFYERLYSYLEDRGDSVHKTIYQITGFIQDYKIHGKRTILKSYMLT